MKTLRFEDRIWDKGRNDWITRQLTITGSDAHGLPTEKDDEVLLGLIQLTRLRGFGDRKVFFTRHELIRMPTGFVLGVQQALSFAMVFCAEGILFSGFVVLSPVNGTPAEHAVFLSHNFSATSLRKPKYPRYGAVRVLAGCWPGAVKVSAVLLTFLLTDASRVLLNHSAAAAEVWRRGSESNRRMRLLQSPALPLGYPAPMTSRRLINSIAHARASFSNPPSGLEVVAELVSILASRLNCRWIGSDH